MIQPAHFPNAPRAEIAAIRPISRIDLPRLRQKRDSTGTFPGRLRDSHHFVARLLAAGFDNKRVAALTGYSQVRIQQLSSAPAMQDLIASYRAKIDESWAEVIDAYTDLAVGNMIAAERQLRDHIAEADETGDLLPVRELVAISADRADRFGYGKKSTSVNVNVDFAARLESAIARSKTIEGRIVPASQSAPGLSLQASNAPAQPFRRIA